MKTAVEFLEKGMEESGLLLDHKWLVDLIEQAKAMEKEQIVTTWNTAHQAGRFEGKGIAEENWQTFETYWELTFKSE